MRKILYVMIGGISLILGALGSLIPVLPTAPFLLLAAFCFARSSKKLDHWFKNTKLYKDNLEDFVADHGNPADEYWLHYDGSEGYRYRLRRSGLCMGIPYHLLYFRH